MQPDEPSGAERGRGREESTTERELLPLLYEELRRVAAWYMEDERTGHTLQPTALVHEAWLRLMDGGAPRRWEGRAHFVRTAARAMRNVLVDHARARAADKRGGGRQGLPLDLVLGFFDEQQLDVLALHDLVERLIELDEELGRIIELRFFAGLSVEEAAQALGISRSTADRRWQVARMWLRRELEGGGGDAALA